MVVLDESKENFILDVPYVEEVEAKLREEERRRTGRYLAVSVVLFLIGLGLYHMISHVASKMSALISAAMIMFMYIVWLLYAAQRRKHRQIKDDLDVEKQVTSVLENLNNIKSLRPAEGSHENHVYSSSEDEVENKAVVNDVAKVKNKNLSRVLQKQKSADYYYKSFERENAQADESSRKSSKSSDIFIRTYSIA